MLVDTGSSDVWIVGKVCSGCPTSVALYDNTASSTAVNKSTASTTIEFGSGTVEGYIFADTISMGSLSVSQGAFRASICGFYF